MPPQQPGGMDKTIPTMMITQYRQLAFKKPFIPVRRFQVMPLARAASPAGTTAGQSCSKEGGISRSASQHPSGKGSDKEQESNKQKSKMMSKSKGGFDVHVMDQGDVQAGPSHSGWPALPTAPVVSGVKCTASF